MRGGRRRVYWNKFPADASDDTVNEKNSHLTPDQDPAPQRLCLPLTQWVAEQFAVPVVAVWQAGVVHFQRLEFPGAGLIGPLHSLSSLGPSSPPAAG
jgi:hypothetical protein